MRLVIVIPTYNERENICDLLNSTILALDNTSVNVNILVADDNSPDGTKNAVLSFVKKNQLEKRVAVISKNKKTGLKDAYFNAFNYCIKEYEDLAGIIQMDADFSHNPKYLIDHINNLIKGYDLSIGSRYVKNGGVKNWGAHRIFLSKIGNMLNRFVLSPKIKDYTGGFNAFSKQALLFMLPKGKITSGGYYFQTEMKYLLLKNGFSYKEFPIIFVDRQRGESKMSGSIIIESIKQLISIRIKH